MKVIRETTIDIDFTELLPGMEEAVADVCQGVKAIFIDCELRRDSEGIIECEPCAVVITDMVIDHIGRSCVGLFPHMFHIVKGLIAEETERAERGELFEDEY